MKIALLNFSGNVGKTTFARDLLKIRMNGYKISRLLKFDKKYQNIPILMITARSQEEDKLIGEETGANEYITKPFDLDEVLQTVQKYLATEEEN